MWPTKAKASNSKEFQRIPKNSKTENVTYQSKKLKFQRIPKNSKGVGGKGKNRANRVGGREYFTKTNGSQFYVSRWWDVSYDGHLSISPPPL